MEGKGFEPTVEALFGKNGFFPDTALKTMYFVSDNMPVRVSEILQNILPALKNNRMKRQVLKPICFVHMIKTAIIMIISFLTKEKSSNRANTSVFRPHKT